MKEEIEAALKALEVKGIVTTKQYDCFCFKVYVDGKEFGLWDSVKKTFVE